MLKSPCRFCENRITGDTAVSCHERCKDYIEYKNTRKTLNYLKAQEAGQRWFDHDESIAIGKYMERYIRK